MQVCSSQAPITLYYAKEKKKKMGVKSGNEGTVSLDKFLTAECKVQRVFFKTASCCHVISNNISFPHTDAFV